MSTADTGTARTHINATDVALAWVLMLAGLVSAVAASAYWAPCWSGDLTTPACNALVGANPGGTYQLAAWLLGLGLAGIGVLFAKERGRFGLAGFVILLANPVLDRGFVWWDTADTNPGTGIGPGVVTLIAGTVLLVLAYRRSATAK